MNARARGIRSVGMVETPWGTVHSLTLGDLFSTAHWIGHAMIADAPYTRRQGPRRDFQIHRSIKVKVTLLSPPRPPKGQGGTHLRLPEPSLRPGSSSAPAGASTRLAATTLTIGESRRQAHCGRRQLGMERSHVDQVLARPELRRYPNCLQSAFHA